MGTLVAALPPQRALDASAAAALQHEGFQVARPAAVPDAMRYRECHLTLRPRYGHGSLEDTYRATIRTVVVSEPNRPRRSARRALAELTTALHTYTLVEPGQAHPTPLVPISRVGSVAPRDRRRGVPHGRRVDARCAGCAREPPAAS